MLLGKNKTNLASSIEPLYLILKAKDSFAIEIWKQDMCWIDSNQAVLHLVQYNVECFFFLVKNEIVDKHGFKTYAWQIVIKLLYFSLFSTNVECFPFVKKEIVDKHGFT